MDLYLLLIMLYDIFGEEKMKPLVGKVQGLLNEKEEPASV